MRNTETPRPRRLPLGVGGTMALLTLLLAACGGTPVPSSASTAAPTPTPKGSIPTSLPTLEIMAMDYTFQIPATVKAGLMVVTFRNDGKEPHELSFLRLNEGVSVKQFQTQLEAFPPKAFLLSKWRGGIGPLLPGQSERWQPIVPRSRFSSLWTVNTNFQPILHPFRKSDVAERRRHFQKSLGERMDGFKAVC